MVQTPKTSWRFFLDYPTAWNAMIKACENAKESIDIEQYIIRTDEIGLKFLSVLQRRAEEGIKVRIIADATGSLGLYGSLIPLELRSKGIKLVFFHALFTPLRSARFSFYLRDHRKLLIVDSTTAFTGGICIADHMQAWRDTLIEIKGPVVQDMRESFDVMYDRALYSKLRIFGKKQKRTEWHDGMQYLTSTPFKRERELYLAVLDAIRSAKRYIYITTPYFVPDRNIVRVLRLAVSRGVDVKVLIPKNSDVAIVDLAAQSYFEKLLKAGIEVYRYGETMIHSKTMCIDGEWGTVGSLNIDHVSLKYNYEGNVVSTNKDFVTNIKEQFLNDLTKAEQLTKESWDTRSSFSRFLQWIIRPLRPFL